MKVSSAWLAHQLEIQREREAKLAVMQVNKRLYLIIDNTHWLADSFRLADKAILKDSESINNLAQVFPDGLKPQKRPRQ